MHCFDDVTIIIFFVDLTQYDQVLLEDSDQNRLMESMIFFDSIVNLRWFKRTSILLLLANVDGFRRKLVHSPFSNYFKDYSGGNDVKSTAAYIVQRFNQLNRNHLNLIPQMMEVEDNWNIGLVQAAVQDAIITRASLLITE